MSKHIRKILPLLLCLFLMACLLPAAYADGVEVSTLEELQAALNANTSKIIVIQNITLDDDLTIPESCYVKVRHKSILTIPAGKTLTVNGKLEASFEGRIDVVGMLTTKQRQGEIEMFEGGVIDVSGTFANNNYIMFGNDDQPENESAPKLIIENGATYTGGALRILDHLNPGEVVQGIDMSGYCHHIDHRWNENVYYPASQMTFELMLPEDEQYIEYLEVHGVDTLELSANVEIPVFGDGTISLVDMHETRLVVPSGKSVTVNGQLAARELVIESGGRVTVNGYLDAVNGITLNNNGVLTVNNTHIDAGYVPSTDIEALKNIVYNDDAGLMLHLVVGKPEGVPNAIQDASDAVDEHVNCIVELRTDWTMTGSIDAPDVALKIPKEYTVTVNGELTVGEIQDWGPINLTGMLDVGKLRLDGNLTVSSGGTLEEVKLIDLVDGRPNGSITLADGSSKANLRSDGLSEALMSDWITLQDAEARMRVYYHAKNDEDFASMTGEISNLPANIPGALTLEYPAVIRGNVDFPGVELRVEGKKGGSLTIAEGAVLTASNINFKKANVTISGTFIAGPSYRHTGSLTLNDANSTLTVTETGILGGYQCTVEVPKGVETASCVSGFNPGQMKDVSHPYRPSYQIYLIVAEMSLPSGLTTIESEAFAGGSFNSVYIPASVTSIASDAFGDRTVLKVYGESNTAAETFAHDHGFPFAPPNLATQPA